MTEEDKELEYFLMREDLEKLRQKKAMWDRRMDQIEIESVYDPQLPVFISNMAQIEKEIRILRDRIAFLQYGGT